ncbi:MAG TPA: hypothetical protein VLG47_03645 [Candidatus Saccharimonadales bacterium]|nr:hypothetical protein [Candidatus Saccharimonadales bacterium]
MGNLNARFPRYSKFLRLYPKKYRDAYGSQMLQTLADMLDNSSSTTERLQIWTRLAIDFPITVAGQNVHYLGGIMTHETPKYVWRNGLIGGAMLIPFFAALTANSIDELAFNHTLFNSWLWSMPILAIWVLWLPFAAALLCLTSLLTFISQQRKSKKLRSVKVLIDIRHNWPLVIVAIASSFILALIFFHDSVHCVTGNPIREIHNPSATWHCIQYSK